MEDGSAVRLVRPNGADAKLRARTDRCRATYSGSRLLGEDYTFIGGGVKALGRDCAAVPEPHNQPGKGAPMALPEGVEKLMGDPFPKAR